MKRRDFLALTVGVSALPLSARAQQAMPVVGFMQTRGPEDAAYLVAALRRGLRDGGFIDGQNVRLEVRWAEGHFDRLPALAQELSRIPVDVLVAGGGEPATMPARAVTSTIPIVFAMSGDPVKLGFAASFNRPGGNITGVNILTTTLEPKRLGLLRDLVPDAATFGFLVNANPDFPPHVGQIADVQQAARETGISVRILPAASEREIDAAFDTIAKERIRALAVGGSPFFDTQRHQIVALAARHGVPAMYHFREYSVVGGLINYGVDMVEVYRQLGIYASQILKGAKPADMPVLLPTKFDLVINLKTAKALGLTIPSGVLSIADEVIE